MKPAAHWSEISERGYEDDYAALIHFGAWDNSGTTTLFIPHGDERARWKAELAEPWFQAMRERARRDGLRIECFVGHDNAGLGSISAAARLANPDGTAYDWRKGMEALFCDWGETLIAAREQHPHLS
jgi:hypothetical protein